MLTDVTLPFRVTSESCMFVADFTISGCMIGSASILMTAEKNIILTCHIIIMRINIINLVKLYTAPVHNMNFVKRINLPPPKFTMGDHGSVRPDNTRAEILCNLFQRHHNNSIC